MPHYYTSNLVYDLFFNPQIISTPNEDKRVVGIARNHSLPPLQLLTL